MAKALTRLTIPADLGSVLAGSAAVRLRLHLLTAEVADRADQLVPVGSADEHLPRGHEPGTLKESQRHGVSTEHGLPVGFVAYLAYWAHMVHNGTSHSHPNPWLLNAALSVLHRSES